MSKLWEKGWELNSAIERFTVGKDRELDLLLAPYDIQGTMAHVTMLSHIGYISKDELNVLLPALEKLHTLAQDGKLVIEPDIEDIHSQVELMLTRQLGDVGKKVHIGRSRNDQVMVDIKLFTRASIKKTAGLVAELFNELQEASEKWKNVLLPGYTHLQVAMPSSFGLWLGAYAEALADDLAMLKTAFDMANRNPLGAAAGYGSSIPIDREETTKLLGFEDLDYNSVYALLGRGKFEKTVAWAYASLANTIGRFAADCCLYMSPNFGFISLPAELTTGSSIMPHKKNPDVFELVRAGCNKVANTPDVIGAIMGNLPSGYFRDTQILKEDFLPMFGRMDDILGITAFAVANLKINEDIYSNPLYLPSLSVERVNALAAQGVPFRDAYKQVGLEVAAGTFQAEAPESAAALGHTHAGSIGNLCTAQIAARFNKTLEAFLISILTKD